MLECSSYTQALTTVVWYAATKSERMSMESIRAPRIGVDIPFVQQCAEAYQDPSNPFRSKFLKGSIPDYLHVNFNFGRSPIPDPW